MHCPLKKIPKTFVSERGGRKKTDDSVYMRCPEKANPWRERAAGTRWPQAPPALRRLTPTPTATPEAGSHGGDSSCTFNNRDVIYKQQLASTKVLELKYSPV